MIDSLFGRICLLLIALCALAGSACAAPAGTGHVSKEARRVALQGLVRKEGSDVEKLALVNGFFNRTMVYASDDEVWGQADYWATPDEFMSRGAGDCEDFAIAKFFALKAMGVDPARLSLAYASLAGVRHVVCVYRADDGMELVLDNGIDEILPLAKRTGLVRILVFDEKEVRIGTAISSASRIASWQAVLQRLAA